MDVKSWTYHVYCSRAMGDASSAVNYFEESVEFLSKLPTEDLEVINSQPLLHIFLCVILAGQR